MTGESTTAGPDHGPRAHDIGAAGVVVIAVDADDVRVQGVDGTEVRVVAPADGVGILTEAEPGRFVVRTRRHAGTERSGFVGLTIGGRGFGFPLDFRVSGTIELEVPRDASVEIGSAAGDVMLRDLHGGAVVRTASGDVSVKRAAGRIAVSVASGDVTVLAAEPISLEVHSVSGDVRARAPRFERVAIETISGNAELAGAFGTESGHAVSTVSGDVELAVLGGLTLEVKTISGDVDCRHPDRREGDGRKQPLVIGDGAARLAVRSMSGDVEVRPGTSGPSDDDGAEGVRAPRFAFPPLPPLPRRPPAPSFAAREAPTASSAASPVEPTPAASPATLAVLEALARGDIDVAEAERRLADAPAAIEATPDA